MTGPFAKCLSLVLALATAHPAICCIFKYGDATDSMAAPVNSTHWNYATLGVGWVGKDATGNPWTCSGKRQSPVNIPPLAQITDKVPAGLETTWQYGPLVSNGSDVKVINTGHTIQVQWDEGKLKSSVSIATKGSQIVDLLLMKNAQGVKRFDAVPLQFHFHSSSEHTLDGAYYPLELHIVHKVPAGLPNCPPVGCITVTGIMLKLVEEDNKDLAPLFDAFPFREGASAALKAGATINLQKLIGTKPSYITYQGSLTTPPCSEGLLWHVLTEPVGISQAQFAQYKRATSDKECTEAPKPTAAIGHRKLASDDDDEAKAAGGAVTCTMGSFSDSYRMLQPRNNRVIRRHIGTVSRVTK